MSDKHVSQEPLLDASVQKPKYEAPAIIDLSSPTHGASGECGDGSSNTDHCWSGTSASWACDTGYAAALNCVEGSGF